jgi:cell division septal protein FtsQ
MASFRKKHLKNKIHGIKPKKSIFTRLWFWLVLLFFVIALSGFYVVLFYPGLQVKDIIISGNEKVKSPELQELVSNYANTGLVNFWTIKITSRSIFLVDLKKMSKDILEKFPVIEKADINKNYPRILTLVITERKPLGVYCPSESSGQATPAKAPSEPQPNSSEQADSRCFLIDQNGIIFEPLSASQENLIIVRQLTENGQVFTGEEIVAQNMISAIYKIQKSLKDNFKIDLKEALVTSPVRLNVKTGENWQIYFDLSPDADINLEITKLNLLLNGGISQVQRKNLYYIDLRPKDRAIICDNMECGSRAK